MIPKLEGTKWLVNNLIVAFPNERSENAIKITLEYVLLNQALDNSKSLRNVVPWAILRHTNDYKTYHQAPYKPSDPSSHDNTTAMLSTAHAFGLNLMGKEIKIWGEYWHPRDLIFYHWLKGKAYLRSLFLLDKFKGLLILALTYPFFWLMIPIQWWSCFKKSEYGKENVATSTKLLAWMRCQCTRQDSLIMELSWRLNTWTLKRHNSIKKGERVFDISTWKKVFGYYYKGNHPIRKFPKTAYENKINFNRRI